MTSLHVTNTQVSYFHSLPDVLYVHVFGFLSPEDLARVTRVNTLCHKFANQDVLWNSFDLQKLFPDVKVLGKREWQECIDLEKWGLDLSANKRELIVLIKGFSICGKIKKGRKYTLLESPRGVSSVKIMAIAEEGRKNKRLNSDWIEQSICLAIALRDKGR